MNSQRFKYEGIVVVGTDTDIGKTYISCGIAELLKKSGYNIGVCKPFASGSRVDAKKLISASGSKESISAVNPLFYKYPMAPACSAIMEKKVFCVSKAVRTVKKLIKKHKFVLCEGIGGLMVPITGKMLFVDFLKKIDLPVVVVCVCRLGGINHTLLTCEALKTRNVKVIGIIANKYESRNTTQKLALREIARITKIPVLAEVGINKKLKGIGWIFRM